MRRLPPSRSSSKPAYFVLLLSDESVGLEIYRDPLLPIAIAFAGKRQKPDWYFRYTSEEKLAAKVADYHENIKAGAKQKQASRDAKKGWAHDAKVGDIFQSSWGYDQTNIDYYEITKLIGSHFAEVCKINSKSTATAWLQGECVPAPGCFETKADRTQEMIDGSYPRIRVAPRRLKIQEGYGGEPRIKVRSFASAYRIKPLIDIDGVKSFEVDHWTAYA